MTTDNFRKMKLILYKIIITYTSYFDKWNILWEKFFNKKINSIIKKGKDLLETINTCKSLNRIYKIFLIKKK